jgi:hypothetical protein
MAFLRTHSLALIAYIAGCSVGEVGGPGGPGPGPGPDGGGSQQLACVDRAASVAPAHVHDDTLNSHQGEGCVVANCHGTPQGPGAPPFTFAGTAFKLDGTTPNAGATIRIYTNSNPTQPIQMQADADGNFYTGGGINPFPAHADMTACPNTMAMSGSLASATDGSCSSTACHGGATGKIILPD